MKNPFNKNDFNSGDGMLTTVWGPSMWHSLHTISFNYPFKPTPNEKKTYYKFFLSLKHILPCKFCRINYVKNLKAIPLTMKTMKNRHSLSKWLYDLHEEVNKMLGKKSNLSYDDIKLRYEMFRSRCVSKTKKKSKKKRVRESRCFQPLY